MQNIESNLEQIEILLSKNKSLLEIINGYCLYFSEHIDEVYDLLDVLSTVINNHKELQDKFEILNLEIFKARFPIN